jgi:hypothetical protein
MYLVKYANGLTKLTTHKGKAQRAVVRTLFTKGGTAKLITL